MRIGVLTGGGDCPGLNPAIRGIVFRAMDYNDKVIGFEEGWKGPLNGLTRSLDLNSVDEIINWGGTILFTSRTNPFAIENGPKRVIENLKRLKIDALVAIGGDDTLGVAAKLYKLGVRIVGVPKTMDNDLSGTDYTFGFDTSVTVAIDALSRLRDTARSHKRIIVLEVMGRHAGWVALFTGIAGGADWVLLPEEKPDFDTMCAHLRKDFKRKGYALVVVSEGAELLLEAESEVDQFGHKLLQKRGVGDFVAHLIKEKLDIPTRSAVIGHIQRGGAPTLFDRMLGSRTGVKAVDMIHKGEFGKMAAIVGNRIDAVPLEEATGKPKIVSKEWLDLLKVFLK